MTFASTLKHILFILDIGKILVIHTGHCAAHGNLLKGTDKKTVRRKDIEPIKKFLIMFFFSVAHFL